MKGGENVIVRNEIPAPLEDIHTINQYFVSSMKNNEMLETA